MGILSDLVKFRMAASRPTRILREASFNFGLGDETGFVEAASASALTGTIPANVFPLGTILTVFQTGSGALTVAAGAGVVLAPSSVVTSGQLKPVQLWQHLPNEWVAFGGLQ